jgi:hypothetical protein
MENNSKIFETEQIITNALNVLERRIPVFRMTYGPIKGNLVKIGIILADMVVEAMTREFIQQNKVMPNKKHSQNISKLKNLGVHTKLISAIKTLHSR